MAIKISCCIDCVAPKRHPGCHDKCPMYQTQKKLRQEQIEKEKLEKTIFRYKHDKHQEYLKNIRGREKYTVSK